jgi:hypothetical protein
MDEPPITSDVVTRTAAAMMPISGSKPIAVSGVMSKIKLPEAKQAIEASLFLHGLHIPACDRWLSSIIVNR